MSVKKELIESANQIREKYRALKKGRFLEAEERLQTFQPLIEPLEELKNLAKAKNSEQQIVPFYHNLPAVQEEELEGEVEGETSQLTPSRIPVLYKTPPPKTLAFGKLAAEYLSTYLSRNNLSDTTYGIRNDKGKFYIGNKEIEIFNDNITIGDKSFEGTRGLWELLTLKEPKDYSKNDLKNYKEILQITSAHKKGFKDDAQISSNKFVKYNKIIKPLFEVKGTGMREVTHNKIDYIYWDDPNELVNRLRLLVLSKQAGNTGVDNEIDSIIEELKESGIIY